MTSEPIPVPATAVHVTGTGRRSLHMKTIAMESLAREGAWRGSALPAPVVFRFARRRLRRGEHFVRAVALRTAAGAAPDS